MLSEDEWDDDRDDDKEKEDIARSSFGLTSFPYTAKSSGNI